MRPRLERLEIGLYVGAATVAVLAQAATFITIIPPTWAVPAFFLVFGGAACSSVFKYVRKPGKPSKPILLLMAALFVYALLTSLYDYRTTDGMTSVTFANGQHLRHDKGVTTPITEEQYQIFSNLLTRVLNAWLGMAAAFGLINVFLAKPRSNREERHSDA